MAQWVRQNTAVKLHIGPAVATGGLTAVTTLTSANVTALNIIRHGATVVVAAVSGGAVAAFKHVSDGHYIVSLASTRPTTVGHFTLYCRASGAVKALPFWAKYVVVPANVYDSLVSGSAKLNVGTLASAAAVWTAATRLLTSGSVMWTATPRTLTSGLNIASSVWNKGTRLLTSGAVIWSASPRTLTSGLQLACSVWAHVSGAALGGHGRTLISGSVIWSATPRTLTSGLQVASSVWAKTVRTLSSAGVVWTAGTRVLTSGSVMWSATPRTLTSGLNVASSVWAKGQTELAAIPAAAPAAGPALMFLYMSARNKRITTATGDKVHNSATTVIATAPISASSTTFTKSKYA